MTPRLREVPQFYDAGIHDQKLASLLCLTRVGGPDLCGHAVGKLGKVLCKHARQFSCLLVIGPWVLPCAT